MLLFTFSKILFHYSLPSEIESANVLSLSLLYMSPNPNWMFSISYVDLPSPFSPSGLDYLDDSSDDYEDPDLFHHGVHQMNTPDRVSEC